MIRGKFGKFDKDNRGNLPNRLSVCLNVVIYWVAVNGKAKQYSLPSAETKNFPYSVNQNLFKENFARSKFHLININFSVEKLTL